MENLSNARPDFNFYNWDEQILNLAKSSTDILKLIFESKENGTTVGISSPLLGQGFFITAVEDIILSDGETTILLKPFDVTGFLLPTNKLTLADIEAACPLISTFENPVLKNLEKEKNWFF